MPRRDIRSPSPAGNAYSSSNKHYGHHRYRDVDKRYDDRGNYRRKDRSGERNDEYRPPVKRGSGDVRPSSRTRKRSRSRSPSPRRNNYRDRRGGWSRDRGNYQNGGKDTPTASAVIEPTDEEKKQAERLAKLAAWKAKQAAEREIKLQRANGSIDVSLPSDVPSTPTVTSISTIGKFDVKSITKRTLDSGASKKTVLGIDVTVPVEIKAKSNVNLDKANVPAVKNAGSTLGKPVKMKASGNLGGFGLGNRVVDPSGKTQRLDFDDEQATHRKLEKLPTPPLSNNEDDAALGNADKDDEDDDDSQMVDGDNDEEALAAARATAEKRMQAEVSNFTEQTQDTEMADAPPLVEPDQDMEADQEEIDPLDAFMADLNSSSAPKQSAAAKSKGKSEAKPDLAEQDGGGEDMTKVLEEPEDILAMAIKKKKRDTPAVDHSKITYEPFRRNFYTEPADMVDMTEEELADLRLELDGIKVRGKDVPKPVTKWAQCGLGIQVLDVIRTLGYERPTSIQCQAIPAIMSGRDVISVAKTGSGKTIAYLLPMFRHIKDQRRLESMDGPIAIIMSPTRELATQIHRECKPFLKALNLRAVCAYGGAPIKDQIADFKRGAEIVVCTPGRMIELLAANSGRVTNLKRVTYTVLDEADRMFDMGFEPQVMKIITSVRPDKQIILFSATFPKNMDMLARKALDNRIEIVVGGRSVVAPEITQVVEVREEDTKFKRTLELLGELYNDEANEDSRALIFVDRQDAADWLLSDILKKGYPCGSIHGGKDQVDRSSTIDDFKAGVCPILIATSVAARGLDVKQLKLVINYDAPNHLEDYVHRAGRTGRAGNTGTAVTFITPEQERYSVDIMKALKQSGIPVPPDLQSLADGFIKKVNSGEAKISGSGFGGKGLEKLDLERDAARKRERSAFGAAEDQPKEEEEQDDEEAKVEEKPTDNTPTIMTVTASAAAPSSVYTRLIDEHTIVVHKTEISQPTTVKATSAVGSALDKARAAGAHIGDRLRKPNQLNLGHPIDNKGPDAGAYHATLEINDYPQKARWSVTNRTNVAKIIDATSTSITTKGSFWPHKDKEVGPGDAPKLYILVEGDTELSVTNAMREMMRLLREGTVAAMDHEARAPNSGRYSVL